MKQSFDTPPLPTLTLMEQTLGHPSMSGSSSLSSEPSSMLDESMSESIIQQKRRSLRLIYVLSLSSLLVLLFALIFSLSTREIAILLCRVRRYQFKTSTHVRTSFNMRHSEVHGDGWWIFFRMLLSRELELFLDKEVMGDGYSKSSTTGCRVPTCSCVLLSCQSITLWESFAHYSKPVS